MEKINIAELLKDCPKGMELDCAMYENVTLFCASDSGAYPIKIETPDGLVALDKYGCYSSNEHAKCIIFPKGKTTWDGFHRPFDDGDIVATKHGLFIGIVKVKNNMQVNAYCSINDSGCFGINSTYGFERLATKEEKQQLFDAIKSNGYKWNAETKTLEKLVEPKFRVGDEIRIKGTSSIYVVTEIREDCYMLDDKDISLLFKTQDQWELAPNKFDITTLKPFDKVLVRDNDEQMWTTDIFSFYNEKHVYHYMCVGHYTNQCIPYEGNEHLLGKTDDCDEFYKTWE